MTPMLIARNQDDAIGTEDIPERFASQVLAADFSRLSEPAAPTPPVRGRLDRLVPHVRPRFCPLSSSSWPPANCSFVKHFIETSDIYLIILNRCYWPILCINKKRSTEGLIPVFVMTIGK